jgi:hypothetical protein
MGNTHLNWLDLAVPTGEYTSRSRLEYIWGIYLDDSDENPVLGRYRAEGYAYQIGRVSDKALARQRQILKNGVALNDAERTALLSYTSNSGWYVNDYLRYGKQDTGLHAYGMQIDPASSAERAKRLFEIVKEKLPPTGNVTLYRGGYEDRGTSGRHFRNGLIKKGDILVNADFLSFTENPFTVVRFCKRPFEPTTPGSVVFILRKPFSARPIAPLSMRSLQREDESLCPPLCFFQINAISDIRPMINGAANPVVIVELVEQPAGRHIQQVRKTPRGSSSPRGPGYFDFRTGEPFDYGQMEQRLRP